MKLNNYLRKLSIVFKNIKRKLFSLIKNIIHLIKNIIIILLFLYIKKFYLLFDWSLFWNHSYLESLVLINNLIINSYISWIKVIIIETINLLKFLEFKINIWLDSQIST